MATTVRVRMRKARQRCTLGGKQRKHILHVHTQTPTQTLLIYNMTETAKKEKKTAENQELLRKDLSLTDFSLPLSYSQTNSLCHL